MTDSSTPPVDLHHYVDQAAAAIGLSIAAEDMPAVVGIFTNLARVATPLMAFPLPADTEPSPVFTAGGMRR
jgi:1-carboxybiuret hydrolase subunit AtzG-like protein